MNYHVNGNVSLITAETCAAEFQLREGSSQQTKNTAQRLLNFMNQKEMNASNISIKSSSISSSKKLNYQHFKHLDSQNASQQPTLSIDIDNAKKFSVKQKVCDEKTRLIVVLTEELKNQHIVTLRDLHFQQLKVGKCCPPLLFGASHLTFERLCYKFKRGGSVQIFGNGLQLNFGEDFHCLSSNELLDFNVNCWKLSLYDLTRYITKFTGIVLGTLHNDLALELLREEFKLRFCRREYDIRRPPLAGLYNTTSRNCILCLTAETTNVIGSCGHACLCWQCAAHLYTLDIICCPYCQDYGTYKRLMQ